MYNTIQNIACVNVALNEANNRYKLTKDIISGKAIQSMFVFGQGNDYVPLSPFTNVELTETGDINKLSLFLNLFDKEGNHFVKDYLLSNFNYSFDNLFPPDFFANRQIDIDQSYISILNNDNVYYPVNFLLYVIYDTNKREYINRVVSGSKTIEISFSANIEDKKLSDLINYDIRDKQIKKISVHSLVSDIAPIYFDIVCKNGYRLENVPINFFRRIAEKEIYLNNIIIDPENSFLRLRNSGVEIEFSNHISFIY